MVDPITLTDRIVAAVCDVAGVWPDDIFSRARDRCVAYARMCVVYLVRQFAKVSYPALGRLLNLHHTTCLSACRRVFNDIASNGPMRAIVLGALRRLESPEEQAT